MLFCDFKIARKAEAVGGIEVLARLYEGAESTQDEPDVNGVMQPVTRYRRTGIIGERLFKLKSGATDQQIEDAITGWANKATALQPIPAQKTAFDRTK